MHPRRNKFDRRASSAQRVDSIWAFEAEERRPICAYLEFRLLEHQQVQHTFVAAPYGAKYTLQYSNRQYTTASCQRSSICKAHSCPALFTECLRTLMQLLVAASDHNGHNHAHTHLRIPKADQESVNGGGKDDSDHNPQHIRLP
nr:hypothetical protein CFP56_64886 [Quercus suber]